ncbi:MAG: hypothetical protein EHM50_00290 [Lysobacterales bacterium]|nr:MAG: hypothetical protein EHM50_00290 [Xanthomonadales bacterium]
MHGTLDVVAAKPEIVIGERATASRADFLVIGVHGWSELARKEFRQMTAGRLLQKGDLPVLLVARDAADPYRHFVMVVDFSVFSRAAQLRHRRGIQRSTRTVRHPSIPPPISLRLRSLRMRIANQKPYGSEASDSNASGMSTRKPMPPGR